MPNTEHNEQTYLGAGLVLRGDVKGTGNMHVNASVRGSVLIEGNIRVGAEALIEGALEGANIDVEGDIKGNVLATDAVRIRSTARVEGAVHAPRIVIEEHAVLLGAVHTTKGTPNDGKAPSEAVLPEWMTALEEPVSRMNSNLASQMLLVADVFGEEDFCIHGHVEGRVSVGGVIQLHGKITGELEAKTVVLYGEVEGSVRASETIHIHRGAVLHGDALAPQVSVDLGAAINGKVQITSNEALQKSEERVLAKQSREETLLGQTMHGQTLSGHSVQGKTVVEMKAAESKPSEYRSPDFKSPEYKSPGPAVIKRDHRHVLTEATLQGETSWPTYKTMGRKETIRRSARRTGPIQEHR